MSSKLSNKTNGFSLVEVLLVLIFVGVVALIGMRVVDSRKQPVAATATAKQQAPVASTTTKTSAAPVADALPAGEINKLGANSVSLTATADVEKLPAGTPASFKEFMKIKLAANKPTAEGCVGLYTINVLSTVNVAGGVGDVDAKTLQPGVGNCGGGARIVWSFSGGAWQENGFQSIAQCSLLVNAGIYKEFVGQCADSKDATVANPNGSITQLKK